MGSGLYYLNLSRGSFRVSYTVATAIGPRKVASSQGPPGQAVWEGCAMGGWVHPPPHHHSPPPGVTRLQAAAEKVPLQAVVESCTFTHRASRPSAPGTGPPQPQHGIHAGQRGPLPFVAGNRLSHGDAFASHGGGRPPWAPG